MNAQQLYSTVMKWFTGQKPRMTKPKGAFGSALTSRVDDAYNAKLRARAKRARLRKPAMLPAFARDGFKTPEGYFAHHAKPAHSNPMFDTRFETPASYANATIGPAQA